jgi:hypothetical protein
LTRPEYQGAFFEQGSPDGTIVRRWDSWYDPKLVTRHGEDILRDLDDWGVAFLRRERLVWSGWQGALSIVPDYAFATDLGVRAVDVVEPRKLRLFFLSLLWRAASSNLQEFSEIVLPDGDIEVLRASIVGGNVPAPSFYPCLLTQLSTLGIPHNMSPIADTKRVPSPDGTWREIPIFRFYLDGLIAHFHRPHSESDELTASNATVGTTERLLVTTVPYERSIEASNLLAVMFPDVADDPL